MKNVSNKLLLVAVVIVYACQLSFVQLDCGAAGTPGGTGIPGGSPGGAVPSSDGVAMVQSDSLAIPAATIPTATVTAIASTVKPEITSPTTQQSPTLNITGAPAPANDAFAAEPTYIDSPDQMSPGASMQPAPGAETVSYSQAEIGVEGNWVKKRKWLEQALEVDNTIQKSLADIQRSRKVYYEKFTHVDRGLDTFYRSQGVDQGKLSSLFDSVTQYLEDKKERMTERIALEAEQGEEPASYYDYRIDELTDENETLKKDLEQLRLDLKSIDDLDKSLAERLKRVDQQIDVALQEAAKTTQITQKMWHIIDDRIARDQYYQVKNSGEKIKSIFQYITVTLQQDYERVIARIQQQIEKVRKGIKAVESKGIIIQNRTARLKLMADAPESDEEEPDFERRPEKRRTKTKKRVGKPWYLVPLVPFIAATSLAVSFVAFLYDMVLGPTKEKKKKKNRRRRMTVEELDADAPVEPEEFEQDADQPAELEMEQSETEPLEQTDSDAEQLTEQDFSLDALTTDAQDFELDETQLDFASLE